MNSTFRFAKASALLVLMGLVKAQNLKGTLRRAENDCQKISLEWESVNGELRVGGEPFHLKGTSWFGFETQNRFPHGLWSVTADSIFTFLKQNNFNTVRLPFSAFLALNPDLEVKAAVRDPEFTTMTAIQLMEAIVDKAAKYDILIMLDLHRLNEDFIPELWYDDIYTFEKVLEAWDNVLTVLGPKWNVFAVDLKNEPHGGATWGFGDEKTDWNTAAQKISNHIISNHPDFKGLLFVEGTQLANVTDIEPHAKWWGGDLEGASKYPILLEKPEWTNRIVYSPHVYGPDVFDQDEFNVPDFPNNLAAIWDKQWAFVENSTGRAVVIGEWGGHYENKDKVWQDALADYLVENCLEDTFYWCLNPNSGDTGGLLDYDFATPKTEKLKLLDRVQPHPSWIKKVGDNFCYTPGQYANPNCRKA